MGRGDNRLTRKVKRSRAQEKKKARVRAKKEQAKSK
jgi:hypothetical protein